MQIVLMNELLIFLKKNRQNIHILAGEKFEGREAQRFCLLMIIVIIIIINKERIYSLIFCLPRSSIIELSANRLCQRLRIRLARFFKYNHLPGEDITNEP